MTDKQKKFCDEYLIDGNATQAAIRAGYALCVAKRASRWLNENTPKTGGWGFHPDMREYIDRQLELMHNERIADAEEVMQFLTSVMRGENAPTVLSMKAAELLGKRYGLFRDNINVGVVAPVVISGGDVLED